MHLMIISSWYHAMKSLQDRSEDWITAKQSQLPGNNQGVRSAGILACSVWLAAVTPDCTCSPPNKASVRWCREQRCMCFTLKLINALGTTLALLLSQQGDNLPTPDGFWEDDTEQTSMQKLKEQKHLHPWWLPWLTFSNRIRENKKV